MECPNCKMVGTLTYNIEMLCNREYSLRRNGKISNKYKYTLLRDSQLEYCYCKNCLKEFGFTIVKNKVRLFPMLKLKKIKD